MFSISSLIVVASFWYFTQLLYEYHDDESVKDDLSKSSSELRSMIYCIQLNSGESKEQLRFKMYFREVLRFYCEYLGQNDRGISVYSSELICITTTFRSVYGPFKVAAGDCVRSNDASDGPRSLPCPMCQSGLLPNTTVWHVIYNFQCTDLFTYLIKS